MKNMKKIQECCEFSDSQMKDVTELLGITKEHLISHLKGVITKQILKQFLNVKYFLDDADFTKYEDYINKIEFIEKNIEEDKMYRIEGTLWI